MTQTEPTETLDAAFVEASEPQEETTTTSDLGAPEEIEGGEQTTEDSSPRYTVKVDGEEFEVTLDEALAGYQRQEHFTRAQQDLAAQRRDLEHAERIAMALETDPERTIRLLAEQFQLQVQGQSQEPSLEEMDPDERLRYEFDQFKAQQEQRDLQLEIDHTLSNLHGSYGEFNDDELIEFAIRNEVPNLNMAFQAMSFERMQEAARRQAGDDEARQRKATAPPVAGGRGVAQGAVTAGSAPSSSLDEAFSQALSQHNASL